MYKFQPILKSTIWGGEKIVPYKHIASDQKQVGESWELSGVKGNESVVAGGPEAGTTLPGLIARHGAALLGKANAARFGQEFPLLIKFIDARQDLSIQVHPNDALAWERHKSKGKTEMWYVVDADKGARLRSGFAKQVTPAQYEASVADNTITDLLAEYEIHPGDLFFLPAGRVHSIGAGAFIAEIQQTSDITYRIYDFNRKDADGNTRELHTELAKGAIDWKPSEIRAMRSSRTSCSSDCWRRRASAWCSGCPWNCGSASRPSIQASSSRSRLIVGYSSWAWMAKGKLQSSRNSSASSATRSLRRS